ncbi:MAG: hypothetical protein ACHP93_00280 [Solirubrobacterales bacterium]
MRSVKIALAVALALMAAAIGAVLAHSPLTVAGANSVQAPLYRNGSVLGNSSSCQPAGTLPAGTSAIRISLGANADPEISVKVLADSRLVTQGTRSAGGGLNASATVPVMRISNTVHDALLCMTLGPSAEPVGIRGIPTQPAVSGAYTLHDVKLRLEYLRPGPKSWWSLASSISYHFGLGRAAGGRWIGFLVLALMLAVAVLATRLTLRELE